MYSYLVLFPTRGAAAHHSFLGGRFPRYSDGGVSLSTLSTMDEIVPHLWIGDLPSALDVVTLKAKKIFSVVTAMRGKITINAVRRASNVARCSERINLPPPPDVSQVPNQDR